jgi:peptidoglycan/xylan/chitin deacetylase (PgdA/CDA1 family)
MPVVRSPSFLSFLARWDGSEDLLRAAIAEVAGHPIEFVERQPPSGAAALFNLFGRDPLDAVTQGEDGTWTLPYNPWLAYRQVVEERYLKPRRPPLHAKIRLPYHRVPGPVRMALYPLVAGRFDIEPEACPPDPAWPIEQRIDSMRATLYRAIREEALLTGSYPVVSEDGDVAESTDGAWPGGRRYPLLVTHDVDTREGMGLRPCFFLVGHGYPWDAGFIDAVHQAGGEIGLHGDVHDNRIAWADAAKAGRRLDSCKRLIRRHDILGFRSPSLLVSDALYEALGPRFAWDSSVPDTDTHTLLGARRGCGTTFPFRRGETLVLPTTMPADDRLQLLGYEGLDLLDLLRRKWLYIRQTGGLCHFITHAEPHLFGRPVTRDLYRALLREILDAGDAWVTTPSEVAGYWRALETQPQIPLP